MRLVLIAALSALLPVFAANSGSFLRISMVTILMSGRFNWLRGRRSQISCGLKADIWSWTQSQSEELPF